MARGLLYDYGVLLPQLYFSPRVMLDQIADTCLTKLAKRQMKQVPLARSFLPGNDNLHGQGQNACASILDHLFHRSVTLKGKADFGKDMDVALIRQ